VEQYESVGAWIAASDSSTEAFLKRVVADIAADQLKEARLKRRLRLEEINHPSNFDVWNLTDRH
tara:strand:- start:14 stop:205 length:192 start_codon:yes stop_codon:yes gene_type:complete